jgi:hypothetical protein
LTVAQSVVVSPDIYGLPWQREGNILAVTIATGDLAAGKLTT